MAANSLLASGIQALCYLAYRHDQAVTAEDVARSMETNPVVIRKLLKALEGKGLVRITQGRHGGVALAREPKRISLRDIYEALGEGDLFALRERGSPRCPVNRAMKGLLIPVFDAAGEAAARSLASVKLSALMDRID
jgi:Rrf2 family protein